MTSDDDRVVINHLNSMDDYPRHGLDNTPKICYTQGICNGGHEYLPVLVVWNPALKTLQDVEDCTEKYQAHMFYGWVDLPFYEPDQETKS